MDIGSSRVSYWDKFRNRDRVRFRVTGRDRVSFRSKGKCIVRSRNRVTCRCRYKGKGRVA